MRQYQHRGGRQSVAPAGVLGVGETPGRRIPVEPVRAGGPQFERGFVQFHWRQRAGWSPERWSLELAVFRGGEPMGMQAGVSPAAAAARGEPLEHRQLRLTRPDWLANRYREVEVTGLDCCREMFGAG
jgi:hypothetical protein